MLMPSLTSSPECLLCTEVGLQAFCPTGIPLKDVRVVRVDDYLSLGHDILRAMIEKGKKVYPAEEVDSMIKLVGMDKALGFKEVWGEEEGECEIVEEPSRFDINIYNFRAWCSWVVGAGIEEGSIREGVQTMQDLLSNADNALPSLGPVPNDCKSPKAFHGSKMSPVAVVFSDDAQAKYSKIFKMPVVVCKDVKDLKDDDKYPVLLMEPEALIAQPDGECCESTAIRFMQQLRESKPDTVMITVVLDKDFESMKGNSWLILALHQFIENCDATIFATFSEAEQVSNFLCRAKHQTEHVGRSLCTQCVPFPRLHFFTMSTAMGQELDDNEIMVPAVTVGSKVTGIPPQKFNCKNRWSPFFLTGKDLKPLAPERLIVGADGFDGATVIMPMKVLIKLFRGVTQKLQAGRDEGENDCDDYEDPFEVPEDGKNKWETVFGEKYKEVKWEQMALVEADSNVNDLISEYQQYGDYPCDKEPL
eukprot:TRINITY_DN28743_c0_g1_i2.p1 TRINITY_DN28743_c0_g1~~TRINITY_DN28743_c0_g1_i2.p1  ORF type:complete len:476 (-),score=78.02 TRINITY_DN28743_c0_g1_i2:67-1494(-)